jgi:hypothetical protein
MIELTESERQDIEILNAASASYNTNREAMREVCKNIIEIFDAQNIITEYPGILTKTLHTGFNMGFMAAIKSKLENDNE